MRWATLPAGPVPAQLRLESGMDRRVDEDVWRTYDGAFADPWRYSGESFDNCMRRSALGHVQC
jgi:hypothetical protein